MFRCGGCDTYWLIADYIRATEAVCRSCSEYEEFICHKKTHKIDIDVEICPSSASFKDSKLSPKQ